MNNTLRRAAYMYIFFYRVPKNIFNFIIFTVFEIKGAKRAHVVLYYTTIRTSIIYLLYQASNIDMLRKKIYSNRRICTYTLGILHIQSNPFNTIPFFTRSTAYIPAADTAEIPYILINIIVLKAAIRYNVPSHRST